MVLPYTIYTCNLKIWKIRGYEHKHFPRFLEAIPDDIHQIGFKQTFIAKTLQIMFFQHETDLWCVHFLKYETFYCLNRGAVFVSER